jgi:hypothetical protein
MKRLAPLALAAVLASAAQAQLRPPSGAAPGVTPPAPSAPAPAAAPRDAEKEKAGQNAAHAWLLLLDRRDWGTAWEASSAVFRQTVPLGTWMDNIPGVRASFGNFVEREALDATYKTTLAGRPAGDYVSVVFRSKFEKKPGVQEIVTTVREPDGRWRVTGYTYSDK